MPRVWNIGNKDWPAGAVYIGRHARAKWANPFVIDHDGDREEASSRTNSAIGHLEMLRASDRYNPHNTP
jgi:hypothetical protein